MPPDPARYPTTPDGRYFVVRGRLWRCTNPGLDPGTRAKLVRDLMDARRDVAKANRTADPTLMSDARRRVEAAKVGLGERGAVWWEGDPTDYNRHLARTTPYADWFAALELPPDPPKPRRKKT